MLPPTFCDVSGSFYLSQTFEFVRRVTHHPVKDTAVGVFPIGIAAVGQFYHLIDEPKGASKVAITRLHSLFLSPVSRWVPDVNVEALTRVMPHTTNKLYATISHRGDNREEMSLTF